MKRFVASRWFCYAFIIVGLLCGSFGVASSADKPFYEGKTMVLIVPTNPGGGFDFYGRIVAKMMEEELPGSTIIVKNVPGAGNIIGINELYRSKPDGLTFAIVNPGLITAQLIGEKGINFDLKKASWIGVTGESPYGLYVSAKKYNSLDDIKKLDPFKVACGGVGTLSHVIPMMAVKMGVLVNTKLLMGYRGAEPEMAIMQGQIDGTWNTWSGTQNFVKEGNGRAVLFIRSKPKGYENVVTIDDLVTEKKDKSLIDFMEAIACTLQRGFLAPPDMPPDRLQTLQQAFKKAVTGPKYEEFMAKSGSPAGYISPDKQAQMVNNAFQISAEQVSMIKSIYEEQEKK